MIVMKFGGTSVGDAARIAAVCDIVSAHLPRRPVVVVSALAGVTDLLVDALRAARRGERESVERSLSDLERRHRWALGSVATPRAHHDLALATDALFEELRQLLRSMRILGEGTPRASDAVLAYGESLSARIVVAALLERGVRACRVDPREVMVTDGRHGAAEPDLAAVEERCGKAIAEPVAAGHVPVLGGFVGATPDGVTTTLGRGGSDTSASVLGAALGAEEIQIWTDVDGVMSADPKLVPEARTLETISFAEAAELAYYGARVLHPASIAPAVRRRIPVRVLNSQRPEGAGTRIVLETGRERGALASVASRGGLSVLRVTGRTLRMEPGFLPSVLAAFERSAIVPDLVVSSEVAVCLVVQEPVEIDRAGEALADIASIEATAGRALVCVVGSALLREGRLRARVLAGLSALEPELVALGGAGTSASAVVEEARLAECVRALHRDFFERAAS